MAQQQNATKFDTKVDEEIKVTDQSKRSSKLEDQFKNLHEDLSGKTGEAKSLSERIQAALQGAQRIVQDVPGFNRKKSEEKKTEDVKTESVKTEKDDKSTTQQTFRQDAYTKFDKKVEAEKQNRNADASAETEDAKPPGKVASFSKAAGLYMLDAFKETFPTERYKLEKAQEKQKRRREAAEYDRRVNAGEDIPQEEIPEWKRQALVEVEEKLTKYQTFRKKVKESALGARLKATKKGMMASDTAKELSEEIKQMKEGTKDIVDDSDNVIVVKAREAASKLRWESQQAKAIATMRMYEPDFDVYEIEAELELIVKDAYEQYLSDNMDYLKAVADGQAYHFLRIQIEDRKKGQVKLVNPDVVYMTKPVFMGINLEEKDTPRFNYNCTIYEQTTVEYNGDEEGRAEWEAKRELERKEMELEEDENFGDKEGEQSGTSKTSFHISIARHPEPDIEQIGHMWQLLTFQPTDDQLKLD